MLAAHTVLELGYQEGVAGKPVVSNKNIKGFSALTLYCTMLSGLSNYSMDFENGVIVKIYKS